MGVHEAIGYDRFPDQSEYVGAQTKVVFNYRGDGIGGEIVRDDRQEPYLTIIRLDDGRHVLATECQYAHPSEKSPPTGPRLIAAAPDLLAALQRLVPLNINLDHPGLADDVTVPCDVTLGELRAARDAIIKAGG